MNKLHCTDRGIPRWSEHRCHVETGPGYQFCSVCRLQRCRWWTVGRFGWQNRDANLSRRRWWRQQKSTSPSRFWSSDERRKVSSFPLKFWTLSYYHLFFYLLIHRWHRLGISIKGNVVTLIKDCEQQVTRPLPRQGQKLSSSGIILIGQQLLDESFYSVREWEVAVCARSCILYSTFADTCLYTKIDCHLIIQFHYREIYNNWFWYHHPNQLTKFANSLCQTAASLLAKWAIQAVTAHHLPIQNGNFLWV